MSYSLFCFLMFLFISRNESRFWKQQEPMCKQGIVEMRNDPRILALSVIRRVVSTISAFFTHIVCLVGIVLLLGTV